MGYRMTRREADVLRASGKEPLARGGGTAKQRAAYLKLLRKEQRAYDKTLSAAHHAEVRRYKQYSRWSDKSQARLEALGKRVGYDDPRYLRALHRSQAEGAKRYVAFPFSPGQVQGNPRKVKGTSTTLRNMASVTITKQPNGVVVIRGRKA